jgi:hypothetical protein
MAFSASMAGVVGGGMVASDLGSMVVSLMHHAPVLRHHMWCGTKESNDVGCIPRWFVE